MAKKKTEVVEVTKKVDEIENNKYVQLLDVPVTSWLSTGCSVLDFALSDRLDGGIPEGRVVVIKGQQSTCKTVIGMTILGANQRRGGISFFADIEGTFDAGWAKLYGLDPYNQDTFKLGYNDEDCTEPETVEEFFDKYLADILAMDTDKPRVIVVDSLAALSSQDEMDDELSKGSYRMGKAKMISAGFRKYIRQLVKTNTTLIFLDQLRVNVSGYGKATTTGGGTSPGYYASTIIELKMGGKVLNSKKNVVGVEIDFLIEKNKASIPFRAGTFRILFNYGMDDIWSSLYFIKSLTNKSGGSVEFNGENKAVHNMIPYVETHNLEAKLRKATYEVWKDSHMSKRARKERIW